MPVARKAALALCAIAALAIAALLFAAPPAAYADDGWTYDPVEHTLANDSGVVLNNVTADDSGNLTIEGTVLHPALNQGFAGSLDLTGAVKGTGGKTYLITAIGENAFKDCASLESVAIPDGVKTIGRWAFYSCTSLESVAIPDGVESTGSRAFQECRALASVAILGGVGSIGGYAFLGCASLERVAILAATPPTLGDWAFSGCAARLAIVVPAGSLEAYEGDIDWSSLNLKAGYPLKVNGKALPGLYAEGDEVAAPEGVGVGDGQHAKWTLEGEGGQAATVMYGTLEMPGRDAKATCTAEPHTFSGRYCTACGATNPDYVPPAPTYAVEVATTEGGAASASPARARAGQRVTVACSPEEGFEVRSVSVSGRDGAPVEASDDGDGAWSFRMPAGGAVVEVAFGCDGGEHCPSAGFADVDTSQW